MGGSSGPASAGGDYMEQYAGMDMGGSSGSASETNRWKLFSLLRLAANSAAHLLGALLCKLQMPSISYSRLVLAFLSSVVSASTNFCLNLISLIFLLQLEALSASTA